MTAAEVGLRDDRELIEDYRRRWPWLFVDEYQDIDVNQYDLVRLLVPSPAGGPTDFAARLITPGLSEALGENVVVDNRGSANGIVV